MIGFIKKCCCSQFKKQSAPDECKKWRIDNENWELLDKDTAEFFFLEGEKLLNAINAIGEKITQRCYTLINILITICPLFIGIVMFLHDKMPCISHLIIQFILICIISIWALFKIVLPRESKLPGREPSQLVDVEVLSFYGNSKDRKRNVMILEIERIQDKISFTEKSNKLRTTKFGIVLTVLLIAFIILCLASLLTLTFLT